MLFQSKLTVVDKAGNWQRVTIEWEVNSWKFVCDEGDEPSLSPRTKERIGKIHPFIRERMSA